MQKKNNHDIQDSRRQPRRRRHALAIFLCDNNSLKPLKHRFSHQKAGFWISRLIVQWKSSMKSLRGLPSPFQETSERDFPSLFLALFGSVCVFILRWELYRRRPWYFKNWKCLIFLFIQVGIFFLRLRKQVVTFCKVLAFNWFFISFFLDFKMLEKLEGI